MSARSAPAKVIASTLRWVTAFLLLVAVSSCGVALHKEKDITPRGALPEDPYLTPRPAPHLSPVSTAPLSLPPGHTVVSITFDDGRASNALAGRMLIQHGLSGTFFVNSGKVGQPGFLSLRELDALAIAGNEIAGHTATHPDLDVVRADEARRQICDDRAALLDWGYPVRSFAYPFASATPELQDIVRACGYNSARSLGELRPVKAPANLPPDQTCQACAVTEAVPPENAMYTRAPGQYIADWAPMDLERRVMDAVAVGGWLQLTFHGLCPGDCSEIGVPVDQFDELLRWLATLQANGSLLVRTVGDVIGGPVEPEVVEPLPAPAPPGVNEVVNPGLEERTGDLPTCWMRAGFGQNSALFSLVPDGHQGDTAGRLEVLDHSDGDAKLIQSTDLGACAPAVTPGHTYTISAWYRSTAPTKFSVQYRLPRGRWEFGLESPQFAPSDRFAFAQWNLPPIPPSISAISFGLSLSEDGVLVTDDYSMIEETSGSP